MQRSELMNKIVNQAVIPELRKRMQASVGIVQSFDVGKRTANVLSLSPSLGGSKLLTDVPMYNSGGAHIYRDPKRGDYVHMIFIDADVDKPLIIELMQDEHVKQTDQSSVVVPHLMAWI